MPHVIKHFPTANKILAALPRTEYERLRPHLESLHLRAGHVLFEPGDPVRYVYFPTGGMLSLLALAENGDTVEVGMVGSEGVTGLPAILRLPQMFYRVTAQLTTDTLRLSVPALNTAMAHGGRLPDLLLRYAQTVLTQVTQSAVCNRFHTTEARLCRWLLTTRDRAQADSFRLTQECMAQMLGVPRTSVTMIAGRLQQAQLIEYRRGQLTILDAQGLSQAACECYRVIAAEIAQFLAA